MLENKPGNVFLIKPLICHKSGSRRFLEGKEISLEKGGVILDHHFGWFEKMRSRRFSLLPHYEVYPCKRTVFSLGTSKFSTNSFSSPLENTALQLEFLLKYKSNTNLLSQKNYGDEFGAQLTTFRLSVIQPALL
jgi:hypothetical protein